MASNVDLRELALDRSDAGQRVNGARQHLLTRFVLPMALIVGFLALVLWASWETLFPPQEVTVMPVLSSTSAVRQEGTPLFNAAGWIEPRPTPIRVAALAPGVVAELLVVEDQLVEAGDPLAELVKDDARLAHDRALADLKLREAELEDARAQLKGAETLLAQPVHLEAVLQQAEADLARVDTLLKSLPFELERAIADQEAARLDYEGKVTSQGVVAGVQIDVAKSNLASADALVSELRDRESSLQKERASLSSRRDALKTQFKLLAEETQAVDGAAAQVKAAQARVEQARVALAETQLRLDRMTITAPVSGRIFRLIAHPGARIGSGMTQMSGYDGSTVVTMYQPDKLQIRVDVRFEDIPHVSLKQTVEIDNPALSTPIMGEVLFISSEADIQKNTLQVKVAIPNPPTVFKPEMLVDVTFLAPKVSAVSDEPTEELRLRVPRSLVVQDNDGTSVWVADQSDGVARKVSIQLGRTEGNLVEVVEGLTSTSRLIVRGAEGLQDGERIKVVGEDMSPIGDNRQAREATSPISETERR